MKFYINNVGVVVNNDNIKSVAGYSVLQLVTMTGANFDNREYDVDVYGTYPEVTVSVATENFELTRKFNFETRVVYNEYFKIDKASQGQGIGTSVFSTQVNELLNEGFCKIRISAVGAGGLKDIYNGCYTWARLGYTMINDSVQLFNQFMSTYGRSEKDITQLMATSEGREFWRKKSFDWDGEFLLTADSVNIECLRKYKSN